MSIPRALRTDLQEDGAGQSQRIETRTIRPLSGANGGSQGRIEFTLPKQGILDKNSYIKFKITGPNVTSRLPISAGAYSMIETATLRIAGTEIQTRRAFNHLTTLKQGYRTPHDRDNRQSKRVGCFTGTMVDGTLTTGTNLPGHWGVNTYADWAYADTADNRQIDTGFRLTDNLTTTPEWIIDLAVLFPILYSNNLPLGLLDNEINIILDLSEDLVKGQRSIEDGGVAWSAGTNIVNTECTLHLDLIFYDDNIGEVTVMERLADELNKGEQLVFTDDTYVNYNQPANGSGNILPVTNKISLGCDNQIVRSVLISTPRKIDYGDAAGSGNELLGQYFSSGSRIENSIQLTVNNNPVYPSPVVRDAEIWNELCQVMPTKYKINSAIYSHFSQVTTAGIDVAATQRLTDKTFLGAGKAYTSLQGNGHYYGINLSKPGHRNVVGAGTPIGRNPLLLELSDTQTAANPGAQGKTVHVWVTTERLMTIMGGKVMVSGS